MRTDRRLNVCVALMCVLATVMLGTSQDSSTLPVIALVVAATSLLFTDFLEWFHLHRYLAGAAGMIAGVNAFMQSQTGGLESQFISVANLLIHLQMILMFQKKTIRIFWQLITLSLLQVVVAAALNLFVLFGPLLVLYTAFALAALLLFFVQRDTSPFLGSTRRTSENADDFIQLEATHAFATSERRRAGRGTAAAGLYRHFVLLSFSTVIVSAGMFLLMPRFGDGVWRAKTTSVQTGFGDDMDLSDSGSIYENPSVVMRVSFFDQATDEPYSVSGYPYFRGRIMDEYRRGKWTSSPERTLEKESMDPLESPKRVYSAVRQQVHMQSERAEVVFTVAPACGLNDATKSMRISRQTFEVRYFPDADDDPVEYSIGTLGFRNGLQSEFVPMLRPTNEAVENRRALQVRRDLPALTAKATEIVAGIPADRVLERARKLEAHFTNGSAGYQYSLDPSALRDPNTWRDPNEDFVMNHKTGHCQFFASALALMLRSQGIPARVVQGFRADSYNIVGGYYQLRQMDAHAWVEAAIPPEQMPSDEILPVEGLEGTGGWVRLDPTPAGDQIVQSVAVSAWRQRLSDTVDYMQLLWSEYVLGLNEKRQRKAIYQPIQQAFKSMATIMFSRELWAARWQAIRARFRGDVFTQENVRDAVIAVAVLTVAFYAVRFAGRLVWGFFAASWRGSSRRRRPQVEFYRRLERTLAKHGIRRARAQTQFEFAQLAADQIRARVTDTAVAEIPVNVVNLFYRVRFGAGRLDNVEVQRLENWLVTLQQSLAKR